MCMRALGNPTVVCRLFASAKTKQRKLGLAHRDVSYPRVYMVPLSTSLISAACTTMNCTNCDCLGLCYLHCAVGVFRKPPLFLKHGDVVTCEIEGIGSITNTVVAEAD